MKTSAARPRAGQVWVCRDGRTLEPDFLAPTDLQGFTAQQVAYGATDGSLTGSSSLTWNGTTFGVSGGVSATSLTDSGLTSGRVTFASTAGLLADSANLTYGSGKLTVADGTASSSTSTGAVVISNSGGLGVSGNAWIGGTINVAGTATMAGVNATSIGATTPGTGKFTTLTVTGYTPTRIPYATTGSTITDNANLAFDDTNFRITVGTMLAGAWTGVVSTAMVVQNSAIAIAAGNYALLQDNIGNTYLNAVTAKAVTLNVNNTAVVTVAAALVTIAQPTSHTDSTASSSSTTGALVVSGGVGIGGSAFIGTNLTVAGTFTVTGKFTISSAGASTFTYSNSGTTDTPAAQILDRRTSGTPAAGFGVKYAVLGQSDTTTGQDLGSLVWSWATATNASRKSRFIVNVSDAANDREVLRGEASGSAPMIGFLGATAIVRPAGTGETVGFTAGAGTAVKDDSTFTGNVGATAYRISDIVKALKNLGLLTQ